MGRIPVLLMVRELTQGGCERDLTRLALGFRDSLFQPHVACFRPGGIRYDEIRAGGVPVADLSLTSYRPAQAWRAARRLAAYTQRHGIQIVHAMDVPAASFATPICRMAGVPVILACQLSYRSMCTRRDRLMMGLADRLADRVVANCQAVLDDLMENYGVARQKATLIYNGVELDRFQPPPGPGRDRSVLPKSFQGATAVIGAVCALRREKRLDQLIEAFAQVRKSHPGVRLAIVGSGVMEGPWKALAERLGVASDVHFEPSTRDVERWMQAMDVFVMASELESFPNGLLEAMACGCAPVGSRVGGVPEMLGPEGLLFPVGDAAALSELLEGLLQDPKRMPCTGAAARRRAAEMFSLQENLRRTAEVYAEALAQKGIRA